MGIVALEDSSARGDELNFGSRTIKDGIRNQGTKCIKAGLQSEKEVPWIIVGRGLSSLLSYFPSRC